MRGLELAAIAASPRRGDRLGLYEAGRTELVDVNLRGIAGDYICQGLADGRPQLPSGPRFTP